MEKNKCPFISSFVITQNQEIKPAVGFCLTNGCTFWLGDENKGGCALMIGCLNLLNTLSSIQSYVDMMIVSSMPDNGEVEGEESPGEENKENQDQ